MRNTIYLIRHAEAQSNTNPGHIGEAYLTENGINQAQQLASRLSNKSLMGIYVSNVLRARLTADEIAATTGCIPTVLDFLKERKGAYSKDLSFVPEESFGDMRARVVEAKLFLENLPDGNVVVVSHAILIKALLAYIMSNTTTEDLILEIGEALVIDNATISKLVYNKEKKKWRIMSLNCPA